LRFSALFLLAFVCCESFQHLQSLVLWGYGKKRIIAFGFSTIGIFSVYRLPNQALKLTEWAWEQFNIALKSFALKEYIRHGTHFVFSNIKIYHRGSLAPVRYTATKSLGCHSFRVKLF
jgi:uncharacterized protein Usg